MSDTATIQDELKRLRADATPPSLQQGVGGLDQQTVPQQQSFSQSTPSQDEDVQAVGQHAFSQPSRDGLVDESALGNKQSILRYTKSIGSLMHSPASAGSREALRSTSRPAETAAITPSVPDVSLPQELRDVGVEAAPPDKIVIRDDIGQMLTQNAALTNVPSEPTGKVVLPPRSAIRGVPVSLAHLTTMAEDQALVDLKAILKKEPPKSSKKFLMTQVERAIKMKLAKVAGIMPEANSEEIMNQ